MSKKRYHYDSKGRFKGHSSDQSPQARNIGALAIALPIIILTGMCSKESKNVEGGQGIEAASEAVATVGDNVDGALPSTTANDDIIDDDDVQSVGQIEAKDADTRPQQTMTTEKYVKENYINGDSTCSRDAFDYNVVLCEEGQQLSCDFVKRCNAQKEDGLDYLNE